MHKCFEVMNISTIKLNIVTIERIYFSIVGLGGGVKSIFHLIQLFDFASSFITKFYIKGLLIDYTERSK